MTTYRKDYHPYPFAIQQVSLHFDLHEEHTLVEAQLSFQRQAKGPLCLYGDNLALLSLALDGKDLSESDYEKQEQQLLLHTLPDTFALTIKTKIYPHLNTQLSGLFRTGDFFCTQCEAEGFRRMMFFPDRPDVMTQYKTRITADKARYPVLLSNGNLISQGDLPEGRHWVLWEDPFKKPSYLFALVAGDLACVRDTFITQSGRKIDLRLYVEKGQTHKCAHALAALKHAMRWDEVNYGREYDLDIFMIVAVSDFNMGAMENKGLNIFNAKYILASPETASDADYEHIEGVVAHEYFHNWTGNRVTCRDWFQLSLKEGLTVFRDQSFSEDQFAREVKRIDAVKMIRNAQFPEDASPMAHPVRPDAYEEINNFYTTTIYNKGAEVIRMQETLLGKAGFRAGMDLYFERHDGQAVTIDDFVQAMEDANQVDLTQFKHWYSQAGTPEVTVTSRMDSGKLSLTCTQRCVANHQVTNAKPFHIPIRIAAFSQVGQPVPLSIDKLELRETQQTFDLGRVPQGTIISLLRNFSAPIRLYFDQSDEERLSIMRFETDGFAKWEAAQQITLNYLKCLVEKNDKSILSPLLAESYQHILADEATDKAMRAELLIPPGFEALMAQFDTVAVEKVEDARDTYRDWLAEVIRPLALPLIQTLWKNETHEMTPAAFAARSLRNVCLSILANAGVEEALSHAVMQFEAAKTMTDKISAFGVLVNAKDEAMRRKAIVQFYDQWVDETLVLDKWFACQAMADLPGTLGEVERLLAHPKFSLKNPNKVRALIGSFVMANPRQFHAKDGGGYMFLTEMLLQLDPMNPQVAARLALPLIRYGRLDANRQSLMKAQLERLLHHALSKDLSEVVKKGLG